ncbi:MAG: glycosyltransferase family 4 protein [Flavobacteriales bacterium]|nr:glycosyltransferase family 4 protein [Flavobacteriales bacterium]
MNNIGIISQSPTLTTGFGITTKKIADFLHAKGYQVSCFGIDQIGETFERNNFMYKIWTVGGTDVHKTFLDYLKFTKPSSLFINFDIVSIGRWYSIIKASGFSGKLYAYLILDGTPFLLADLSFLKEFAKIIVPTKHVQNYLESLGLRNVYYAPHGVDPHFYPIGNKKEIRRKLNLHKKKLVGCFGRNTERKQQSKVLQAINVLVNEMNMKDYLFYFHCNPFDTLNSWNLNLIARKLKIEKYICFPQDLSNQLSGVPLSDIKKSINKIEDLNLVERIGICDLCVNIPFSGGFELLNLEIQACGVPLISTNDNGNIAEIVGKGGILLNSEETQIWRTGADIYFISAKLLAETISLLISDRKAKSTLSNAGRKNAAKYNWEILRKTLNSL